MHKFQTAARGGGLAETPAPPKQTPGPNNSVLRGVRGAGVLRGCCDAVVLRGCTFQKPFDDVSLVEGRAHRDRANSLTSIGWPCWGAWPSDLPWTARRDAWPSDPRWRRWRWRSSLAPRKLRRGRPRQGPVSVRGGARGGGHLGLGLLVAQRSRLRRRPLRRGWQLLRIRHRRLRRGRRRRLRTRPRRRDTWRLRLGLFPQAGGPLDQGLAMGLRCA